MFDINEKIENVGNWYFYIRQCFYRKSFELSSFEQSLKVY